MVDEEAGLNELNINSFIDLCRWTSWKPEIYQDYAARIGASVQGEFRQLIANFGFWPRALQKVNVEKAKASRRKPPIMRSTMNARDDNIGKSPLYAPAWQAGRRCLIPAGSMSRTGRLRAVSDRAGRLAAALRRRHLRTPVYENGTELNTMAMITVNADEHPIMRHMHRPGEEKRSVVIFWPDDWDEWLTTPNIACCTAN
ncbi:SOS response-associated peptidase family protein [Burkholderia dolosa]|uniref:SOS response-associated peptidase family protein n=1 Tax=Burkholderia dolosa TaxID=152500 RepID=UPI0031FC3595